MSSLCRFTSRRQAEWTPLQASCSFFIPDRTLDLKCNLVTLDWDFPLEWYSEWKYEIDVDCGQNKDCLQMGIMTFLWQKIIPVKYKSLHLQSRGTVGIKNNLLCLSPYSPKTRHKAANPPLYPGIRIAGIYIDWCIKADFHSVQFSERAEFCDRFLLKRVLSCKTNFIRYGWLHKFHKKAIAKFRALAEWKSAFKPVFH